MFVSRNRIPLVDLFPGKTITRAEVRIPRVDPFYGFLFKTAQAFFLSFLGSHVS